jgi:uroporphyrinogen-III decarboxylase
MEDFKTLMEGDQTYKHVVDIFPATHAERTGTIYVQYIKDHRREVIGMIQDTIRTMKEKRQAEETIVPFPGGPRMVNTSVAPAHHIGIDFLYQRCPCVLKMYRKHEDVTQLKTPQQQKISDAGTMVQTNSQCDCGGYKSPMVKPFHTYILTHITHTTPSIGTRRRFCSV